MRFRTMTAIRASTFRADRVGERKVSPMKLSYRLSAPSGPVLDRRLKVGR